MLLVSCLLMTAVAQNLAEQNVSVSPREELPGKMETTTERALHSGGIPIPFNREFATGGEVRSPGGGSKARRASKHKIRVRTNEKLLKTGVSPSFGKTGFKPTPVPPTEGGFLAPPSRRPTLAPSTIELTVERPVTPATTKGDVKDPKKRRGCPLKKKVTPPPKPAGDGIPWILKRGRGQSPNYHNETMKPFALIERECVKSYFMGPLHFPVKFTLNTSIHRRTDKTCRWNIFGTATCLPTLSCNITGMSHSCKKAYLEIVDGVGGELKVCGSSSQQLRKVQASGSMRDLYLTYKVAKRTPKTMVGDKPIFQCRVECGSRRGGNRLKTSFQPKINPNCYCGTKPPENRIIGGQFAKKFEYPWLAALVDTNTRQPFCVATILNNRFLVTAAHCIRNKGWDYRSMQVIVNAHVLDRTPNFNAIQYVVPPKVYPEKTLRQLDRNNGSRRHNLEEIFIHPLYVAETNDFDVALLKLTEDLELSWNVPPQGLEEPLQQPRTICLPPLGSYLRTYARKKGIVAGWGLPTSNGAAMTSTLRKLSVNVFPARICRKWFKKRINRRMVCAGHKTGGRDSCAGDSGSPLMVESKKGRVWVHIGCLSFGQGCAYARRPGVYFRTTEIQQWYRYVSNYRAGRPEERKERSATWCMTGEETEDDSVYFDGPSSDKTMDAF